MSAEPKTTLGPSPWPKRERPAAKVGERINIKGLALTQDTPKGQKPTVGSKYHPFFQSAFDAGKAIQTPPGTASAISNIARAWLKRQGLSGRVQMAANYGDGSNTGRVWIFKETNAQPQPQTTTAKKGKAQ